MSKSRAEVNSFNNPSSNEAGVSAEYVVAHAARQSQRGKKPSAAYAGIRNPREALQVAQDHVKSKTATDPTEVLALEHGSILAWIRAQDPGRRVEFVAIEELTDAPVETRVRFIDELASEYEKHEGAVPEGGDPRSVVSNIGYIAGYYEPAGYRQSVYQAWQKAEPSFQHPVFGDMLVAHDAAIIAQTN